MSQGDEGYQRLILNGVMTENEEFIRVFGQVG